VRCSQAGPAVGGDFGAVHRYGEAAEEGDCQPRWGPSRRRKRICIHERQFASRPRRPQVPVFPGTFEERREPMLPPGRSSPTCNPQQE
jgi:hypothetical protein